MTAARNALSGGSAAFVLLGAFENCPRELSIAQLTVLSPWRSLEGCWPLQGQLPGHRGEYYLLVDSIRTVKKHCG